MKGAMRINNVNITCIAKYKSKIVSFMGRGTRVYCNIYFAAQKSDRLIHIFYIEWHWDQLALVTQRDFTAATTRLCDLFYFHLVKFCCRLTIGLYQTHKIIFCALLEIYCSHMPMNYHLQWMQYSIIYSNFYFIIVPSLRIFFSKVKYSVLFFSSQL